MKYTEGDKVRIKSKEWYNSNKDEYGNVHLNNKYGWMFTERDSKFCGKVVTILSKGTTSYAIIEDSCEGFWTDDMIEGKVEDEPKFKVGDKITKGKTQLTILNIIFDKYIVEDNFGECGILYFNSQDGWKIVKEEGITTIDKAAEVFAEMLVELCPELLGFGGAAKEWENEFRERLRNK